MPLLICDAWHLSRSPAVSSPSGREDGPLSAELEAVAQRLSKFFEWRHTCGERGETDSNCDTWLVGRSNDVQALGGRIDADAGGSGNMVRLADVTLEDVQCRYSGPCGRKNCLMCGGAPPVRLSAKDRAHNHDMHDIVYISPDAKEVLSLNDPPPAVVVVGMLPRFDEGGSGEDLRLRTMSERANILASDFDNFRAARLPPNLETGVDQASLDIHETMELLQRWWFRSPPGQPLKE